MASFKENLDNLLEYLGVSSTSYSHSARRVSYDPKEPLAYYLGQAPRADYRGPFDAQGIPLYVRKDRTDYLPVHVCFFALGHLEQYRRIGSEENLSKFLRVAEWIVAQQNSDGLWLTPFPMKKFGLCQPFPSAMVQGLVISCLSRAFVVSGDPRFVESAVKALAPYRKDLREGGVASYDGGQVFYEEYPAIPYHHVLNGFIYAMWGLYDLVRVDNNRDAKSLYNEGLKTLIDWLPRFDIGYWSLYYLSEGMRNPATVHYHRLHIAQLDVMCSLTGRDIFREYHTLWKGYLLSPFNALRTLPAKLRWRLAYRP